MIRGTSSFKRPRPSREPYDSVLIVCEGSKTEPIYFNGLKTALRLSNTNVRITPANGTDPVSIVGFAEREFVSGGHDRGFCVFDRDSHANYSNALSKISCSRHFRSGKITAVVSVPCFEVWMLLHFTFTSSGFVPSHNHSPCDCVIRQLQAHLPRYTKGGSKIFPQLLPRLDQAIINGRRLAQENLSTGSDNPATTVHLLVEYLRNVKAR